MSDIFHSTSDENIEKLMKMHPISDENTRTTLINHMICKNYKRLLRAVYVFTQDTGLAEDIIQEAFFYSSLHFNQIKSLSSYVGYNFKTAMNIIRRVLPREKWIRQQCVSIFTDDGKINDDQLVAPADTCDPHAIQEYKDFVAYMKKTLSQLGDIEREVVIRKYFYLENYNSIVKKLGINPQTARSICCRAKKKLMAMISEYLKDD
jgi:RNA polymerase sigma factor (sigma-70 family)